MQQARNSRRQIWPFDTRKAKTIGFSDGEISQLTNKDLNKFDSLLDYPQTRWIHWTCEIYSFGRCYRQAMGIPAWAPLPFSGDHGYIHSGKLADHEKDEKTLFHITWSKPRAISLKQEGIKTPVRVKNPWVAYRERNRIKINPDASGTIVFFPHSTRGIDVQFSSLDSYIKLLKELPLEFQPVVICLHMHDAVKGLHKELRKYNLPIISLGETSSQHFVTRFYDMARRFKYATSSTGSTELLYCEELGVRYFIIGEAPVDINISDKRVLPSHDQCICHYEPISLNLEAAKQHLYKQFPPKISPEKLQFISDLLSLDISSKRSAAKLWFAYLAEAFFKPGRFAANAFGSIKSMSFNTLKRRIHKIRSTQK